MMNKTILMLSVSCMSFIAGADLCYAGFNPYDTPPVLNAAMLKSHVSTHTSHLTAAHLSSLEDIAELTLPENSGPSILPLLKALGSSLSYPLPKDLGNSLFYSLPENSGRAREGFTIPPSPALNRATSPLKGEVNQSYSGLTGVSGSDKKADFFNLDPRIRSEDDKLISEKQGENKLIQLTSVCFVTDTNDCSGNRFANADGEDNGHGAPGGGSGNDADNGNQDDYDLDNAERCKKEGYNKTSCLPGEVPSNYCIYDSTYFEDCTCPSGYTTCKPPYYGVGTACGNKYASCEKDTQRACKELNSNYTNTCGTGQQLSSDRCSYDSSYGTCCNTCAGYDNTTIPDGYVQDGEACVDCNGQPKYKIKPNPCDGFLDCGNMGPDTGATTCLSGSTTKYSNCKPCPNKGTLTSCPSPYTCTYEECSNRYYKSGCQSGYDWNASSQTCTAQCSSSYQYTCSGTGYAGGSGTACGGKYKSCKCSSGYFWGGSGCVKGNDCMKGSEIGYILYSDMTRSKNLISGKTPIGVVVCSYAGGGGQAMALNSVGSMTWGGYGTDIPGLNNFTSNSSASTDLKSCENTAVITAAGTSSTYPAAWAAKNYNTTGTEPGDWCLPAAGIMISIKNNISTINNGFNLVGGAQIGTRSDLWSSSEHSSDSTWHSDFIYDYGLYGDSYSSYFNKDYSTEVRPVIEF